MSVSRNTKSFVDYSLRLTETLNAIDVNSWDAAAIVLAEAWASNARVYICGNGGSASTASHLATDWSKGLYALTGKAMEIISLVENTSLITAFGNDISYGDIFGNQIDMMGKQNDVLILVSGSGNSENIIKAARTAKQKDMRLIGLTGFDGGKLQEFADLMINVPVENMQIAEDLHLSFGHFVLEFIYALHLEKM